MAERGIVNPLTQVRVLPPEQVIAEIVMRRTAWCLLLTAATGESYAVALGAIY